MTFLSLVATVSPLPEWYRSAVNTLSRPWLFLTLATVGFFLMLRFYRWWTRPAVAASLLGIFCVFYFGSLADPNFRSIVAKPDNIPITLMVLAVLVCLWIAFRRAALNDERIAAGEPLIEEDKDDKVLVWPDLVYIELICLILAMAALTLWAIVAKAPLEQPANPGYAPNPAKAPWYFLGLQELLVYFDPWMAGVVYPGLIILGLCALPYLDSNPRGNGYYTFKERPVAIATWLYGFLILWVVMIFFGTFFRGPNWSFFGPYEYWDPHKTEALNNIDVSNVFWNLMLDRSRPTAESNPIPWLPYWLVREWLGLVLLGGFFVLTPAVLRLTRFNGAYKRMGAVRFGIMVVLMLFMALLPIKMVLRWVFNLKYFVFLPEFNANF